MIHLIPEAETKVDQEYDSYLRFHFALVCRHCKSLVMDPDKSKGQLYLRGKCPSCGKESSAPPVDIENVRMSKKQRKRIARQQMKEMKRQKKLADKLARGKFANTPDPTEDVTRL